VNKEKARKKIKAILHWYNLSSKKMTNEQKLELLSIWKDICVEFEEYEIASSLRKKRNALIKSIRKEKIGKRNFLKACKVLYRLLRIKIKKLF
jgi:hypothetical protein